MVIFVIGIIFCCQLHLRRGGASISVSPLRRAANGRYKPRFSRKTRKDIQLIFVVNSSYEYGDICNRNYILLPVTFETGASVDQCFPFTQSS